MGVVSQMSAEEEVEGSAARVTKLQDRWSLPILLATMVAFFLAARFLPPIDTGTPSSAVAAGYTNQLPPLLAILLAGAAILGLLLYRHHQSELVLVQLGPPTRHWRWHVSAALALCMAVVNLAPVWSQAEGYFGHRLMLMDAGERPYVDFEYAYGYLTAYTPYFLHQLGLPIRAALQFTLSLAVAIGVLSFAAITRRWIPDPRYRLAIFWALVVCAAFAVPGPSLNYNFARYALPFALLGTLARRLPRATPAWIFVSTLLATEVVYCISPEMGCAFSAASLVWLVLAWRISPGPKVLAAAGGAVASVVALLAFARPMFTTLLEYSQNGVGTPVVPDLIMDAAIAAFLSTAAAAVAAALSLWRGPPEGGEPAARVELCACVALGAALLPALVGRSWPTITIAYGFAPIVIWIGRLLTLQARVTAAVFAAALIVQVAWVTAPDAREDISRIHTTLRCALRLCPQTTAPRLSPDDLQLLRRFPHAQDPLGLGEGVEPLPTDVGYFPGLFGSNATSRAAFLRKLNEAAYYVMPSDEPRTEAMAARDPPVLSQYPAASMWPFAFRRVRPIKSPPSDLVQTLYAHCRKLEVGRAVEVCAYEKVG